MRYEQTSSILEMAFAFDQAKDEEENNKGNLSIQIIADSTEKVIKESKIIINGETTILITPEGEKIICRPNGYECYDKETGIAMCIAKYLFGSRRKFLAFVEKAKDQTPDHWSRK